jgi:hypothetical protein
LSRSTLILSSSLFVHQRRDQPRIGLIRLERHPVVAVSANDRAIRRGVLQVEQTRPLVTKSANSPSLGRS